jgi:hypothetical protein
MDWLPYRNDTLCSHITCRLDSLLGSGECLACRADRMAFIQTGCGGKKKISGLQRKIRHVVETGEGKGRTLRVRLGRVSCMPKTRTSSDSVFTEH